MEHLWVGQERAEDFGEKRNEAGLWTRKERCWTNREASERCGTGNTLKAATPLTLPRRLELLKIAIGAHSKEALTRNGICDVDENLFRGNCIQSRSHFAVTRSAQNPFSR